MPFMTAVYPETLPHFNKVLAGKLLYETLHLQLEECCNQLGWRDILYLFKKIVQVYGRIHG